MWDIGKKKLKNALNVSNQKNQQTREHRLQWNKVLEWVTKESHIIINRVMRILQERTKHMANILIFDGGSARQ